MLFMKRPLCTHLDLLRPSIQVTVNNKQAQQKKDHDVHTKQQHLQIGSSVLAKNFNSMPTWLPGIITVCLSPLAYSIQLKDRRVWKRHIDHIQQMMSQRNKTLYQKMRNQRTGYTVCQYKMNVMHPNQILPQALYQISIPCELVGLPKD